MEKTTVWGTICKCGEPVYYYPSNLLLEDYDNKPSLEKRIVSITCNGGCEKTREYEFPTVFGKIT